MASRVFEQRFVITFPAARNREAVSQIVEFAAEEHGVVRPFPVTEERGQERPRLSHLLAAPPERPHAVPPAPGPVRTRRSS